MDANQYALANGMRSARTTLSRWQEDPWPVLRKWFLVAAAIGVLLLCGVFVVSSVIKPDTGFNYVPTMPHGPEPGHVLGIVGRNSLVLALHAFACIAGFIAGVTLPLSAQSKKGISRWVHDRARPVAFAWVVIVTCFSLCTQTLLLGIYGSTLAESLAISPGTLILVTAPHALLELTAVFLPLAAWTLASRRDEWDQLLAATMVTVLIAIPMLFASAIWEVHVWPYMLQSVSPVY
jgi:Stage II sporulation protein M